MYINFDYLIQKVCMILQKGCFTIMKIGCIENVYGCTEIVSLCRFFIFSMKIGYTGEMCIIVFKILISIL